MSIMNGSLSVLLHCNFSFPVGMHAFIKRGNVTLNEREKSIYNKHF